MLAQIGITPAGANPFAILTLIAAPAILTNAASVLAMSTSNRFLRASERMRAIATELEDSPEPKRRELLLRQVTRGERQALLLLHALRFVYISLGSFAAASLVSIFGAMLAALHDPVAQSIMVGLALAVGFVGVAAIIISSLHLYRATRLSLQNIADEAKWIQAKNDLPEPYAETLRPKTA